MRVLAIVFLISLLAGVTAYTSKPKEKPTPEGQLSLEQLSELSQNLQQVTDSLSGTQDALLDKTLGKKKADEVRKNLSHLLNEFENAPTEARRLAAAWQLHFVNVLGSFPKEFGKSLKLPSTIDFQKTVQSASNLTQKYERAARHFESNLTRKERKFITGKNKHSAVRYGGLISASGDNNFSKREYEALKKLIGIEKLYQQNRAWLTLPALYDDEYRQQYLERAVELLESSEKYVPVRDTLIVHYEAIIRLWKNMNPEQAKEQRTQQIARSEQVLIDQGIAKKDVRNYIFKLVKIAPLSLAHVNIALYKQVQKDYNEFNAQNIAGVAKTAWQNNTQFPKSLDLLSLSDDQRSDPYGNNYDLVQQKGRYYVRSMGADEEPGTKDDVLAVVN